MLIKEPEYRESFDKDPMLAYSYAQTRMEQSILSSLIKEDKVVSEEDKLKRKRL